eukprot:g6005.t1
MGGSFADEGGKGRTPGQNRRASEILFRTDAAAAEKAGADGINRLCCQRLGRITRVGFSSSPRPARLCILTVASVALLTLSIYLTVIINTKANEEAMPPLAACDINKLWDVILKYALLIPAAAAAVGLARYLGGLARLEVRSTLTRSMQTGLFGTRKVSHFLSNIDSTVDNIDQRIAADVEDATQQLLVFLVGGFRADQSFVDGLVTSLYFTVASIGIFIESVGLEGLGMFSVYTAVIACLSIIFMKKAVKLTFRQQMYEGALRYVHTRVKEFSESIVFYNGVHVEHESAHAALNDVYENQKSLILQTVLCQLGPVFSLNATSSVPPTLNGNLLDIGRFQYVNGVMGLFFAGVLGLLQLFPDLPSIAGLVHRVGEMLEKLDVATDAVLRFERTGRILSNPNEIVVEHLTCATPDNSKVLFKDMSFRVKQGEPLIVMGPSGAGKTSLLRVLGGLWPFQQGTLSKPSTIGRGGMFFLPQRPYITLGTLRQQLIYPHQLENQLGTDDELIDILKSLDLTHLMFFEGGLDATESWSDMLSGGEQQRLGFARLFYHKPAFCIMDESTSALDVPLEKKCMEMCAMYKITAVSVGHRPTLIPFHAHLLELDGSGGCTISPVSEMVSPDREENIPNTPDERAATAVGGAYVTSEPETDVETETFARGCRRGIRMFRRAFPCSQSKWIWVCFCAIMAIAVAFIKDIGLPRQFTFFSADIPKGNRNYKAFVLFAIVALLCSAVLVGTMYMVQRLSLSFRWGLQVGLHSLYFQGSRIYDMNNLKSDEVDNVDQRLTTDLSLFTSSSFSPSIGASINQLSLAGSVFVL